MDTPDPSIYQPRCLICSENPRSPIVTECGHIFCWKCLANKLQESQECSQCRQEVKLQKSYPLFINDEPSNDIDNVQGQNEQKQIMAILKRPKAVYHDKIPNPGMGAGNSQFGISSLTSNVSRQKRIAGISYCPSNFVSTFNTIKQPKAQHQDYEISSQCKIVSRVSIGLFCLVCIMIILFS